MTDRVKFAEAELEAIKKGTKKRLFTDEMYIRMGAGCKCYLYVLPGGEYLERNIRRVTQFGKHQAMISGGIYLGGRTELDVHNLKEGKFTS